MFHKSISSLMDVPGRQVESGDLKICFSLKKVDSIEFSSTRRPTLIWLSMVLAFMGRMVLIRLFYSPLSVIRAVNTGLSMEDILS